MFTNDMRDKDNGLRNVLITALVSLSIVFAGAWTDLNQRIDVLEVQVKNDHDMIIKWNDDIKEVKSSLIDIRGRIIQLQDLKADKVYQEKNNNK
jgi:hypothetical protein